MRAQSPPDACHVMPAESLDNEATRLMVLRAQGQALAIGALVKIGPDQAELKSMHTAQEARGRGCARRLLAVLLADARARGVAEVCLETGSGPEHAAARALYRSEGFEVCPPFGDYTDHPLSVYMKRAI